MDQKERNQRLHQMERELQALKPLMGKAADAILDQEVSSYPVFVVHQQIVDIGIPLIQAQNNGNKWSVNASSLEELATKNVIDMEKVDQFRQVYKDPRSFLCLFVLSELGAQFIFLPRS